MEQKRRKNTSYKKILGLGVEISNIVKATGLSKEEIEKMQKDT